MALSTWDVTIKKNEGSCDLPRKMAEFLVEGKDACAAACAAGNHILQNPRHYAHLQELGINLAKGRQYYYDYSVYLNKLGPARHGVYAS